MTKQEAIQLCLETLRDPTHGLLIKLDDSEHGYTWAQKGSDVHANAVAKQLPITDMAMVLANVNLGSAPDTQTQPAEPSTPEGETGPEGESDAQIGDKAGGRKRRGSTQETAGGPSASGQ